MPGLIQVAGDTVSVYDRIDATHSLFTVTGSFIRREALGARVDNAVTTKAGHPAAPVVWSL